MAGGLSVLLKRGRGLTFTVTLVGLGSEQPLSLNVYKYTTLTVSAVVLTRVSLMFPVPIAAGLLMPATIARVQLNVGIKREGTRPTVFEFAVVGV